MSRLKVFCTRDELTELLRLLCAERGLGALLYRNAPGGPIGTCARSPAELTLLGVSLPCFLFPLPGPAEVPSYEDARLLELSCLVLWPGGETQSESGPVLTGSEFYAPPVANAHLQWLKRRVKKALLTGVLLRHDHLGGERTIKDWFHSAEARRLQRSGIKWRQLRDGMGYYEPLSSE
jgi:hypothetical protein